MKLSAQEEYGLRCLLQVARRFPGGSATIPEIAGAEGLSPHNAARYLATLRRSGLVVSERGQHGGYSLSRPASQIAVAEVVAALGGPLYDPTFCDHHTGAEETCSHTAVDCSIRGLWIRVQEAVDGVLSRTTLQDLLDTTRSLEASHSGESGALLQVESP